MSWQLGVGHCVALASLNLSFLWGELCKVMRWLLGKMGKKFLGPFDEKVRCPPGKEKLLGS